MFRLWT